MKLQPTDIDILENVVGSRGGSTTVTTILIDGKKLVVANVGDSRAILCRNGKAEGITVDHRPLKEKKQVEDRGGCVVKLPGNIPRAMTRAFGDKKVKKHITAKPDVVVKKIDFPVMANYMMFGFLVI
ncbi:Protein phosphatase 1K, mitochondrial [Heracleum sosnowskyi]|uniref:Protein phosphatase 1K, mitochondrial n=1 Tax=Heracleum sosnowskyi TaxID=360622 RepID=A0AAD8GX56_9APIA|nr:Protein phosphatase 1K, mitochondrial [Heracleum sosnowskyi]KAK1358356.1 Protein phosphatase 1K, mitochondrial [Heracleum sosnowskyi]